MSYRQYLFSEENLRACLEGKKQALQKEIEGFDANYILNVNVDELTESLLSKYTLNPPSLIEDQITVEQDETDVDISQDRNRIIFDRSRPRHIKGTEVKFFIPYRGDKELFKYQTSHFGPNHPKGIINNSELIVSITQVDHKQDELKKKFEELITLINKWLGWIPEEVNPYNESLPTIIPSKIQESQTKFQNDNSLVNSLGFKVRKRDGAPTTYAVPVTKKEIKPIPTASRDPTVIEPVMDMKTYDDILKIITNMSLVMERSPKSFKEMDEETLRTHFLVQLNGQYDGQATGETFNNQGKTDILVRTKGKNIFIGECKFWKGKEILKETIDQILRYTSWRDTKTAILLFNQNKDLSKVLEQIPSIVSKHNNFDKQETYESETGFRFSLHHSDDSNKKLTLTILTFEVPQ